MALFLLPQIVIGATQQDLNNVGNQLNNAKDTLKNTQSQKKSLQGEVAYYDNQIRSIEGQIAATDREISKLNTNILATQEKIKEAESELANTKDDLTEIVRTAYEEGQISNIELIAKSRNFSDFINKAEYLEALQIKVKTVVDKIVGLKQQLEGEKTALETAKKKTEELRSQQAISKGQIASQRNAKDLLLQETKGDEAAYQALVKKLQADYNRLQSQLWGGGGNYVSLGHVNAGDIVGYMGNSGFSTGCHLHFEIRNTSQGHVNPLNYIGDGYFIHPAAGTRLTAGYGYSDAYFGGVFHTGVDYADGCRGTPIRATAEGEIIQRVTGYGNTYPNQYIYGNYVKIKHTNGMFSLYGHLR